MTWPQAIAAYGCALVVIAGLVWAAVPGAIVAALPTYVEDPRDVFDGFARTEVVPTEIECPAFLGLLDTSLDQARRSTGRYAPVGSVDRSRYDAEARGCPAQQRHHLVSGGAVAAAGLLAGSALVLALRGRGRLVVVPVERAADPSPIDGDAAPPHRCPRCNRPTAKRAPSLLQQLEGTASLCRSCLVARQIHTAIVVLAASIGSLVAGLVAAIAGGDDSIATSLIVAGCVPTLLFLQVAPHELGHALAGRILAIRVLAVTIGIGAPVVTFDVGTTPVAIRSVPVGGATYLAAASANWYRLRQWIAIASGPAVSLVIIAAAFRWSPGDAVAMQAVRLAVLGTASWILVVNLIPLQLTTFDGATHSDGWHLVAIPFLKAGEISDRITLNRALIAIHDARRTRTRPVLAPESRARLDELAATGAVRAGLVQCALLTADEDWEGARGAVRARLMTAEADSAAEVFLLNTVAWAGLVIGDVDPGGEADRSSERAHRLDPLNSGVLGTRGSILIELGRPEEGLVLLRRSILEPFDDANQALNHCYLAIGEAASGRPAEAISSLADAERLDERCLLLDRARARVLPSVPPAVDPTP